MEYIIYIKLLEEGTNVYRPVSATKIGENVFQLKGFDIYDPEDEIWEFLPGSTILVEERTLSNKKVLVAMAQH
ncbi:hypothetical protein SAMN05428975_4617 [Mucilaginibacter sp. OK268]|uniref:hypothetical protein n=1 Tax=Mucilaginibacter sp. OK268 TaxID=1881048 RepID=UPI000888A46D|nr:hypothetical protein [Mucilaginibacter sp. OK268]SDP98109.1 hypothetical protein SAMN05428975_4617 [Mucilaginibacter sp. OK268]